MAMQDEEFAELQEDRGYGAADEDVNVNSPDQASPRDGGDPDDTAEELTDDLDEAEEDGPGRGAD